MNLEYICTKTVETAKKAGAYIREQRISFSAENIQKKGVNDFVSYVDINAEKLIISELSELLPESSFLAEEGTSPEERKPYLWIIDPLDGTTNFIHDLSPYAVSIALSIDNEIVLGVVYEITRDECFYAFKDSGAFLNNSRIYVSSNSGFDDSLIATGFPYKDYCRISRFSESLEIFMRKTQGIRRLGSAATDLVYVACGRFEAFYEYGLNPWDVAAGTFIVKEAGGKVSDFSGGDDYIFGQEIVATNEHIFKEFQSEIKKVMCEDSN